MALCILRRDKYLEKFGSESLSELSKVRSDQRNFYCLDWKDGYKRELEQEVDCKSGNRLEQDQCQLMGAFDRNFFLKFEYSKYKDAISIFEDELNFPR